MVGSETIKDYTIAEIAKINSLSTFTITVKFVRFLDASCRRLKVVVLVKVVDLVVVAVEASSLVTWVAIAIIAD